MEIGHSQVIVGVDVLGVLADYLFQGQEDLPGVLAAAVAAISVPFIAGSGIGRSRPPAAL
jgi:hypothetical protein